MTEVRVQAVTRRYRKRVALSKVSAEFHTGVHGLLGPNGAGKTTLLKCIATVMTPTSGVITVGDYSTTNRSDIRHVRRLVGYCPQEASIYPRFTVDEMLRYFAHLRGFDDRGARTEAERVGAIIDLTSRMGTQARRLSGGMRRRLLVGLALIGDPDVLVLDEPFAGLDPEQRVGLRDVIGDLGRAKTVVVSTHQTDDVAAVCDRTLILEGGNVLFDAPTMDLVKVASEAPETDETRSGVVGATSPSTTLELGYLSVIRRERQTGQR